MNTLSRIRRFWGDIPVASKIILFATLLLLLIVFTLSVFNYQLNKTNFDQELENRGDLLLVGLIKTLPDELLGIPNVKLMGQIARGLKEDPRSNITRVKIYSARGSLVADSSEPRFTPFSNEIDPESEQFLVLDDGEPLEPKEGEGELVVGRSIWSGSQKVGAVELRLSTQERDRKLLELTLWGMGLAAILLVIGILLSILMARQITNPIGELNRTAVRMAGGNLKARSRSQTRDEIGQLGVAFNEMADAIEKRETDLRELAGSLERTVAARTRELAETNQYLAALNKVTHALIETLDVDPSLERIMVAAAELADTEHAFVNVFDPERGEMERRAAQGNYLAGLGTWRKPNQGLSGRVLATGEMIIEADYRQFEERQPEYDWLRTAIYVPLRFGQDVLGVIGLGYDQVVPVNPDHVDILNQFAQLASLALKNAQLYSETRQGLTAAQQALLAEEEQRRSFLATPPGRAQTLARDLAGEPAPGLATLYDLAERAEQEDNAAVIAELPSALEAGGQMQLARLAQGYDFILGSQSEPGLLVVGLRELRGGLETNETGLVEFGEEAAALYGIALEAIDATSIQAISDLRAPLQALRPGQAGPSPFGGLAEALKGLLAVAEALHAYERVDTIDDRRVYLGRASDGLRAADRLAHTLPAADRPIAIRIIENWGAIVAGSLSELQTRARIACRLITQRSWGGEDVTLALLVRNEGHGNALNLRVSMAESPDYASLDEGAVVERLGRDEEASVELRIRPQLAPRGNQFRAKFVILYDDPRGADQAENFADLVRLLTPEGSFQFVPNPYVAGTPLEAGSPLFFGREDVFSFIGENLNAGHRNNLVLIGQRRTGKSSVLKQLPLRLDSSFVPVYLDGQSIAIDPGLPAFFANLAAEISFALHERGFEVPAPEVDRFTERPAHTFEHEYLRRVREAIGERHVMLMLDEFEELESAARRGTLDASVFGFLRHVIQHGRRFSVIFCGTHRIEELAADYFGVLFNISLYKHIGFLEQDEAFRLIQEPVAPYNLGYDDLALDKMWRITSGHPYFLQLLCHSVVKQHNRTRRSYVTVSDIGTALDDILASGEAHFVYLWNDSSPAERQVLTALSRIMPLTGRATNVQVEDYLKERGISLGRKAITEALHHLTLRDILAMQVDSEATGTAGIYSWRLGLLGLWVEKYKSLSRIQEEIRA